MKDQVNVGNKWHSLWRGTVVVNGILPFSLSPRLVVWTAGLRFFDRLDDTS